MITAASLPGQVITAPSSVALSGNPGSVTCGPQVEGNTGDPTETGGHGKIAGANWVTGHLPHLSWAFSDNGRTITLTFGPEYDAARYPISNIVIDGGPAHTVCRFEYRFAAGDTVTISAPGILVNPGGNTPAISYVSLFPGVGSERPAPPASDAVEVRKSIGLLGYYLHGENVLSTSFHWTDLEPGDCIDWAVVDAAYDEWYAAGGLARKTDGWQSSGPSSRYFAGERPTICYEDFTTEQLESLYQQWYLDPGHVLPEVTPPTTGPSLNPASLTVIKKTATGPDITTATLAGGWVFDIETSSADVTLPDVSGSTAEEVGEVDFAVGFAADTMASLNVTLTQQDGYTLLKQEGKNTYCVRHPDGTAVAVDDYGALGFTAAVYPGEKIICTVISHKPLTTPGAETPGGSEPPGDLTSSGSSTGTAPEDPSTDDVISVVLPGVLTAALYPLDEEPYSQVLAAPGTTALADTGAETSMMKALTGATFLLGIVLVALGRRSTAER
ncbi:MAG: hypothetical protein FWD18_04015 [Micrococcales bacterium]|nr:hypothetical protein [Micrococcales bacterium]